ncbi:peptidylprolyl isomerase [Stieleria neptunia]|uniref:Periplasmic chaperone PpiD n=2 Tax=Stieleria neptunia TaxID=2527979 RepID=A0A518HQ75_9BACT|nr:peptidylprolyl isomerase [Stieleria neptunia]
MPSNQPLSPPPSAAPRATRRQSALRLLAVALSICVSSPSIGTLHGQVPAPPADLAPLPDDPATIMAVVGQSPILWGDIQPKVDGRIQQVLKEQNLKLPPEQLAPARMNLARGALTQAIQTKMMSESFLLEQVGTQAASKRREVSEMMTSRARQMFFENELEGLKEKHGTEDLTELDAKLRETGTSLRARQREFTDMMLGHMYMRSKIEKDPPVTIAEINTAYQHAIDTYRHPAKARWEQLSVLFANHSSREETRALIVEMGREVYYNEGWKELARKRSEEPFAADGGQHDWTSKGSLASKPIEEQVFSIPLDKMSEIIEDEQGLHIIKVLERKEAGVTPLADVQDEIREQIKKEKIAASQTAMMQEMRKKVPVWSIYPDDVPGAKPLRPTSIATGPAADSDYR